MSFGVFANLSTLEQYNSWFSDVGVTDDNSPFSVKVNTSAGPASAQSISDTYMLLKQRQSFTMEYYKNAGDSKPTTITMYINPEKLSINNSKLIAKQVTRSGIFYHHYGADHSLMSLSGSVGLSMMVGIKQIEEVYYASGTLLRYNNYGNVQMYGSAKDYNLVDYTNPIGVVNNIMSKNYSTATINTMAEKMWNINKDNTQLNTTYICSSLVNLYANNNDYNNFMDNALPDICSKMIVWQKANPYATYSQFYNRVVQLIKDGLPGFDADVITKMSLNLTNSQYNLGMTDKTVTDMQIFENERKSALNNRVLQIRDLEQRDKKIHDTLQNGIINVNQRLTDPWLPRLITIYFQNIAYLGHFNDFSYSRNAKDNLITYDLKFTIIKQYEFNNLTEGQIPKINPPVIIRESAPLPPANPPAVNPAPAPLNPNPVQNPPPAPEPANRGYYTVVKNDTLYGIARKFYGDGNKWSQIYEANKSTISDPHWIYPGQSLLIPN